TVDTTEAPAAPEVRRATSGRGQQDVVLVLGAIAAALGLTTVLFTRVISNPGPVGFVIVAYLLFLVLYGVLVSLGDNGLAVRDRLAAVVIHGLAGLTLLALVYVVYFTFYRGRLALIHLNFYYQDMLRAGPLDPLTVGGIAHAAVGTLIEITIA